MPSPEIREWPADGLERVGACPACGGTERRRLYDGLVDINFQRTAPGRWTSWECPRCRSAYLDPRPTPATIGLAYRAYYTHAAPDAVVSRLGRLVLSHESPRADRRTLLDVGAGGGGWVAQAAGAGWAATGLEPDAEAARAASARGAPVRAGGVEDIAEGSVDVITLNHVIEHIHDPVAALARCRAGLRPGGSLWLATPNLRSLGHRLHAQAWYGLDPPRHLVVFSETGLADALRSAGFTDLSWRPGVGLGEGARRLSAAVAARRGARGRALPPDETPDDGPPRSVRERIAAHRATNVALRAVELVAPATADELLVRARP